MPLSLRRRLTITGTAPSDMELGDGALLTTSGGASVNFVSEDTAIDGALTCENFTNVRKVIVSFDSGFFIGFDSIGIAETSFGGSGVVTFPPNNTIVLSSSGIESDADWQTILRLAFVSTSGSLSDNPTFDVEPRVMKFTAYNGSDLELVSDTKNVNIQWHRGYLDESTGDDGTAEFDNPSLPFATMSAALAAGLSIEIRLVTNETAHNGTLLGGSAQSALLAGVLISAASTKSINYLPIAASTDGGTVLVLDGVNANNIVRVNDTGSAIVAAKIYGRQGTEVIATVSAWGEDGVTGDNGNTGGTSFGMDADDKLPGDPPDNGETGGSASSIGDNGSIGGDGLHGCHTYWYGGVTFGNLLAYGGDSGNGGNGGNGGSATGGQGGNGGNSTALVLQDGGNGGDGGPAVSKGGNGGNSGNSGNGGNIYYTAGTVLGTYDIGAGLVGASGVKGLGGTPTGGTGGTGGTGALGGAAGVSGGPGTAMASDGDSDGDNGANGTTGSAIEL